MEHRWGERVGVDIPVRITGHPFTVRTGRLSNLSVSGAFIRADLDVRPLSRILVAIDLPHRPKRDAPLIPAFVARKLKDGIGTQWRNVLPHWDLGLDLRHAQNIARNHVLPTDVQGVRPDSFYKIQSVVGYVARRF